MSKYLRYICFCNVYFYGFLMPFNLFLMNVRREILTFFNWLVKVFLTYFD